MAGWFVLACFTASSNFGFTCRRSLNSYLGSAGHRKVERQCLGMNLKDAEMYAVMSMLFREFEVELWDTDGVVCR